MSVFKKSMSGIAFDFETVTVADSAKALTVATFARTEIEGETIAVITAEGGMMRYRYDGTDPTTTVGHLLSHGDTIRIEGEENITNFRAIRLGTQSGSLSATYERVYG